MTTVHPAPSSWAASARPGDIAMFRFPKRYDDLAGKCRPCLVLAIRQLPGGLMITLAYGTSAQTNANRGFDLRLDAPADWRPAGLHRATRFVLARRITVMATDPRFDAGTVSNPVIGSLPWLRRNEFRQLAAFLGDRIFQDSTPNSAPIRGSSRSCYQASEGHGRTISGRGEIVPPARRSCSSTGRTTRSVIVEHRRKRISSSATCPPPAKPFGQGRPRQIG